MRSLADVNAMTAAHYVEAFGDVAEHSPWVAERSAARRPFASRQAMVDSFVTIIGAAPREAQLALLRAHPDLASKAQLTADSTREQAGAGLGSLSAEEFARFTALNRRYQANFGFPFILAVRGATTQQILQSFEARVNSEPAAEFATALEQVCRIFRFRIEDRVSP